MSTAIEALLEQELARHPLGQEVMGLARKTGTGLAAPAALARVVAGLSNAAGSDARVILILSAMLEKIATYDARMGTDETGHDQRQES